MVEQKDVDLQVQDKLTESKTRWSTPVLTKLKVEEAESGNNSSESGGLAGS